MTRRSTTRSVSEVCTGSKWLNCDFARVPGFLIGFLFYELVVVVMRDDCDVVGRRIEVVQCDVVGLVFCFFL